MEEIKLEGMVTIKAQEYLDLIIDRGRLMFIESYINQEAYIHRETLLDWFEKWKGTKKEA